MNSLGATLAPMNYTTYKNWRVTGTSKATQNPKKSTLFWTHDSPGCGYLHPSLLELLLANFILTGFTTATKKGYY